MVSDLVIRAAAHRKHGDAAQLEARRRASAERQTKLAEEQEQRRRDNEVQRRAEMQARCVCVQWGGSLYSAADWSLDCSLQGSSFQTKMGLQSLWPPPRRTLSRLCRLEEGGVEGETLEEQLQALQGAPYTSMYHLRDYISSGYVYYGMGLAAIMKNILDWHYEKHARQERQLVLDHRWTWGPTGRRGA